MSEPDSRKPHADFTDENFEQILCRIADGETLRTISREMDFARVTFYRWLDSDKTGERANRYSRAREMQVESLSDEIREDAENTERDTIVGENGPRMDAEWVARSRLKIDTKKWLMSKLYPRRYGEKIETTVNGTLAVNVDANLTVEQKLARLRAAQVDEVQLLP